MGTNASNEEKKTSELMVAVNKLFGKLYKYNFSLLDKSNEIKNDYTGEEVFDFFITSHAQSFLKSLSLGHTESAGLILNCRSIIEGLALKRMLKKGDISQKQIDLLKFQNGLIEKKHYKKFVDVAPEAMFPKQMDENYEFCYENFKNLLKDDFSDKQIEQIAFSNIPFLCNPRITYSEIVDKYLGSEFAQLYRVLSMLVHPNPNLGFGIGFTARATVIVLTLLEDEYGQLKECDYSVEKHYVLTSTSYEADRYLAAIHKIASALDCIKDDFFKNFKDNYVSNTMNSLSMILQDMAVDRIFGFTEQMKCKIKPLIEVISSFYKNYINETNPDARYRLFLEHTQLRVSMALGEDYSFDNSYAIYKSIYKEGIDKESFKKAFAVSTGYSIDENGKSSSINAMVRDVAKLIKDYEGVLTFSDTLSIDYVEAQMISHANGYMWFSNSGAFNDTNNVMLETCYLLGKIFDLLQLFYNKLFKETEEYKYRKTSNTFKNAIKVIHKSFNVIKKVQKKPMVNLNSI